jgi:hypothetical protein
MNSRPLLDYLAFPDDAVDTRPAPLARAADDGNPAGALEARLKMLEAMLRAGETPKPQKSEEATLAARIESILGRKAAEAAAMRGPREPAAEVPAPTLRVVVDPPPTAPVQPATPASSTVQPAEPSLMDREFLKFTEAVHLIGQAARRFAEQPLAPAAVAPPPPIAAPPQPASATSTAEIDALSALLRETISAFRSVADDLAVSAGEIRNYATREERPTPVRRPSRARFHEDEDDILELRESVADLQDRLDMMMRTRRRARY